MTQLRKDFEAFLIKNLPSYKTFHPYFEMALSYMLKAQGKRFRPMLLLCVVKSKEPLLIKNAMPIALGLECIHTYSLIHDDLPLMDNANLRRGLQTLHKKYDEVTAILVGDALNTYSFNLLSKAPLNSDMKIELIKILSENGGIEGMIVGQAIDCFFENQTLKLEHLEFLHIHKTAKLIASSLKMGAVIAQYEPKLQEKLYSFGLNIGLLFQIQDDIFDKVQTEKKALKTIQNDKDKNSFVNLLGLDSANKAANALTNKCKKQLDSLEEPLKESLKELLLKYLDRHKEII